jgi:integrase
MGRDRYQNKTWNISADRMKAKRPFTVPLAHRAQEILRRCRTLAGDSDIFPGRSPKKPLSNMVFLMMLRRMKIDITAHGFRSSFRDWASECTNLPREVCEQALAHTIKDKTEAAYRRSDLLDKRRELMAAWAEFLNPTTSL